MPRLRKALFHNHVYFLTCSVESGIILPANPLVSFLIKSALLRAQKHHPINISHLIVNGTHIHMIVRVINPEDICGFMERFKTESAHYLNRLLGRKKRTIWCKGYDSPCLVEIDDVINYIVYLYTNPVKDGLIDTIKNYPGINTWNKFSKETSLLKASLLSRDSIFPVAQNQELKVFEQAKKLLLKSASKLKIININPNDWMKAFNVTNTKEINNQILKLVTEKEQELREQRIKDNKSPMGAIKLLTQGINLEYQPKRSGRKMWCLSKNRNVRKRYINWVKSLANEAYHVYTCWIRGDTSKRMPPGMFAPRMPVLSNLVFLD